MLLGYLAFNWNVWLEKGNYSRNNSVGYPHSHRHLVQISVMKSWGVSWCKLSHFCTGSLSLVIAVASKWSENHMDRPKLWIGFYLSFSLLLANWVSSSSSLRASRYGINKWKYAWVIHMFQLICASMLNLEVAEKRPKNKNTERHARINLEKGLWRNCP